MRSRSLAIQLYTGGRSKMSHPHNSDMKHMILMLLACALPLGLIFVLSLFGITGKWLTFAGIALMILLHVLMMKDHVSGRNTHHKGGTS